MEKSRHLATDRQTTDGNVITIAAEHSEYWKMIIMVKFMH